MSTSRPKAATPGAASAASVYRVAPSIDWYPKRRQYPFKPTLAVPKAGQAILKRKTVPFCPCDSEEEAQVERNIGLLWLRQRGWDAKGVGALKLDDHSTARWAPLKC
jgi:hypothetical protein